MAKQERGGSSQVARASCPNPEFVSNFLARSEFVHLASHRTVCTMVPFAEFAATFTAKDQWFDSVHWFQDSCAFANFRRPSKVANAPTEHDACLVAGTGTMRLCRSDTGNSGHGPARAPLRVTLASQLSPACQPGRSTGRDVCPLPLCHPPLGAGGSRKHLGKREGQGRLEADPRRAAGPQLHDPSRRPRHADAEPRLPSRTARQPVPAGLGADRTVGEGVQAARHGRGSERLHKRDSLNPAETQSRMGETVFRSMKIRLMAG